MFLEKVSHNFIFATKQIFNSIFYKLFDVLSCVSGINFPGQGATGIITGCREFHSLPTHSAALQSGTLASHGNRLSPWAPKSYSIQDL